METKFRDLKYGIDWRPARCTSADAVRGRILISFLALFCLSMARFLYPEFRSLTAESMTEELSAFSLTVIAGDTGKNRRIFSNLGRIIRRLGGEKPSVPGPQAPGQTVLDRFPAEHGQVRTRRLDAERTMFSGRWADQTA